MNVVSQEQDKAWSDRRLVTQFVEGRSQAAFGRLVERYHRLVYSTCWRELRDSTLAEDATQVVFVILAQKAKQLHRDVILSGWLFQTARFTAMDLRKRERRRRAHEGLAGHTMRDAAVHNDNDIWTRIDPWIDETIANLGEKDRLAVLMRFFEDLSFAEIGARLGLQEDSARHRVNRAVEKMQRHLLSKGVAVPAAALASLLAANAIKPAEAAALPSALTLMQHAASGASTHVQTAASVLRAMAMKQAIAVVVVPICAATAGFGVVAVSYQVLAPRVAAPVAATRTAIAPTLASTPTPAAPLDRRILGIWEGKIDYGLGLSTRIIAYITPAGNDLRAAILSPDQDSGTIGASAVTFARGQLHYRIDRVDAAYDGQMTAGGNTITGTFIQQGVTHPLDMDRVSAPSPNGPPVTPEQIAPVAGAWKGVLVAGKIRLRQIIRIMRDHNGRAAATLTSVDQQNARVPAVVLGVDDRGITLRWNAIGATYQGSLSPDGKSMSGTFDQLGNSMPLTLTHGSLGAPPRPPAQ
ncbi:MAG: RNA polymerase sigma factor [Capsulimonadaceae bacterium]